MKLHIKETTTVHPAKDLPNQRLWVSNMDLLHTRQHFPVVYLYKPNGSSNFFEAKVLKESLSKVLVLYYPVAGRLGRDEKGRIEINCNGEGVLFIEAETDIATSDLGDFVPGLELRQLVPTVDYSDDISSYPLLLLQVTTFKCGGVCLGLGLHHTVTDGTGASHFINTWSKMARGLSITVPPFIDRTILRARVPPNPTFYHIEYDQAPTLLNTTIQNQSTSPKANSISNLKITLDQLNTLKTKINNKENKTKYTTFEILAAHIWHCTCKARGFSNDQATKLIISTDGRSRLNPPLPPGYFGSVVFQAASIALSGDLLSESLMQTVERIHKAIKGMDDEYLRSAIDHLEEAGDVRPVVQGRSTTCGLCPNLKINSWMRLPFHDADFGWGSPLLFRPAFAYEGNGYIYPSPTNDGSFLLALCLENDHMQSFQKIFYEF